MRQETYDFLRQLEISDDMSILEDIGSDTKGFKVLTLGVTSSKWYTVGKTVSSLTISFLVFILI